MKDTPDETKRARRARSLSRKKLFLFDIDGTLAVGDTLYDGSAQLLSYIESIGGRACYITNNSTKSGDDYVRKFAASFGLHTEKEQFVTAGYLTLRFLKTHYADKTIFVLGTASYLAELRQAGLRVTEQVQPDIACLVAAYDSELTYEKLCRASQVLQTQDVPFYATNPDLRCPIDFGFVPDCGAICGMLEAATGRAPSYLGKPSAAVVDLCLSRYAFSKEETLVVGDRLYTDIACGINAGVDTCVLFTGEARPHDLRDTPFVPDYAFDDVRQLLAALRGAEALPG